MKTPRLIALSLAFLGSTIYLSPQRIGMDSSLPPFPNQNTMPGSRPGLNSPRGEMRTITGVVRDNQNNGLSDVRIELSDMNGAVVGSVYTNPSGHFEFNSVAPGSYTVVATSGLQQATERVDATNFSNSVNVRMQGAGKPSDGVGGN